MKYLIGAICAFGLLSCQKRDYSFAPPEKAKQEAGSDYGFICACGGGMAVLHLDSNGVLIVEVFK